ncbi:1513_t:CDS:2 [Entrophospora sp. SA101]|nr:1513_t:CDS:2 [Entrophospora sp. SA101]
MLPTYQLLLLDRPETDEIDEAIENTDEIEIYEYPAWDITVLTKNACILLQCFSEIYSHIFNHNSLITFPLQTLQTITSLRKKDKEKIDDVISLTAMKMPEARLRHLPLGFSTLHKPDPLHYCDANFSTNTEPIKILACGHTYHTSCYNNNGSKCLNCLLFLQNVDYVAYALEQEFQLQ